MARRGDDGDFHKSQGFSIIEKKKRPARRFFRQTAEASSCLSNAALIALRVGVVALPTACRSLPAASCLLNPPLEADVGSVAEDFAVVDGREVERVSE